jgi:protocatechuate 4,5-dioxygenase, alpha chain
MALEKPYLDIPDTTVFDADMARLGYHVNQFCMSLMHAENRNAFKADQRAYLDRWPMTEAQKQAVLKRDYSRLIDLGANIYYLLKLGATDGKSALAVVATMTEYSELEYAGMMKNGGRSPDGNRYLNEQTVGEQ